MNLDTSEKKMSDVEKLFLGIRGPKNRSAMVHKWDQTRTSNTSSTGKVTDNSFTINGCTMHTKHIEICCIYSNENNSGSPARIKILKSLNNFTPRD